MSGGELVSPLWLTERDREAFAWKPLGRHTNDWDAIYARAPQTFTPAQIKSALAALAAIPPKDPDGPDRIKTFWDRPKPMPDLSDIDFRDVKLQKMTITDLLASNKRLKKSKLKWHIQHPGQSRTPSDFTQYPIVLDWDEGPVIIDGQHRLGALKLLGASSWPCQFLARKQK